ncbi:response regulator [Actinoplanes sp. NEAU-A12]|uniref:Response regulator n=1 Tax=Actinoplanes sandaracinus TaxID=3045177 RepID=A0ABT6WMH6_9ACTN|nr:response regulator [Actinoplanes sandaracinus]MDI6100944.1 response regulator [Actinoplanes sandaracinus]
MPQTPSATTTAIAFSDADALPWPADDWAAALQPPTVLIADDDGDIRDLVAVKLRAAGYRVLEADNGRTAMSLAVNERPQLVLLDVSRPGLDGLGFCYELHSSPQTAHIPVIIISGRGTPSDLALGRVVGAEDYMVKPFSAADLLRRVERLVPAHP